jgi:hypothetical protein
MGREDNDGDQVKVTLTVSLTDANVIGTALTVVSRIGGEANVVAQRLGLPPDIVERCLRLQALLSHKIVEAQALHHSQSNN